MNWDRWAASTGIGFVVVLLVAFFTYGDAPSLDDSAADKVAFYTDHRGRVLTAMVLAMLAMLAFLWFAATLATIMRRADESRAAGAVLAGAAVLTGTVALVAIVQAGLASSVAASADEQTTAALADLSRAADVVSSFPAALVALAVAVATLRSGILPRLWGWASAAAAVVFASGGTAWATDGFWAPDGAWTTITFLLFLAWTLGTSGILVARTATADAPGAMPAAPAH